MPERSVDDGYVKYRSERTPGSIVWSGGLQELNHVRTALVDLGLIGIYPNGIGYGNLSLREDGDRFTITGTATGALRVLGPEHWCRVEWFSTAGNRVRSLGAIDASSESMTHGAIYRAHDAVRCVIHVHSRRLFDSLLAGDGPRTAAEVPYGTPAMATAVAALVRSASAAEGMFATAGHDEGVFAYGPDITSTHRLLIDAFHAARTP